MARASCSGVLAGATPDPEELEQGEDQAAVRSGWCITGYHRPSSLTVGCRRTFSAFVCPCPCHEPDAADDSQYDSPEDPLAGVAADDGIDADEESEA